jgi:hypothetical protein
MPKEHFVGSGCKKCGYQIVAEKHLGSKQQRRLASIDGRLICNSTDQFIEGAKQVHGDKYDYSKSVYVLSKSKVIIICKEHGEFLQRAGHHLHGYGCPTCGIRTAYLSSMPKFRPSKVKVNSTEYFLARSFAVHGDKYDYSQTEYTGCMNKVKIICRIHGEFVQTASTHMLGCGCQKCGELKKVSDLTRRHRNKSC